MINSATCRALLGMLALALFSMPAAAQAFGAGDLVVVQVGDGSAALSSAATAVFLKEFTTTPVATSGTAGTTAVQTIALQSTATTSTSGNAALTMSGSATSEGSLTRSANGQYLTIAGYNASAGTTGIASTTSAAVNRVVGVIGAAGTVDTSTRISDGFSGNNIRGAVTTNGTDIYAAGAYSATTTTGGIRSTNLGNSASGTTTQVATFNTRVINTFNGQLYASTNSTTASLDGIYKIGSGTSPAAGQTPTQIAGTASATAAYGFVFSADGNTLYVANDSTTVGLQKYMFNSTTGNFDLKYSLTGTGNAFRGLTGALNSNGNFVLYATTTATNANTLVSIVDNGSAFSTSTVLATAAANTAFRGVDFAPVAAVPEPGSLVLCGIVGAGVMLRHLRRRGKAPAAA